MISDFLIRVKVEGQALVDKFKTSVDGVDKSVNKLNSSGSVGKLQGALKGLGDTFSSVATTGNNFADGMIGSFGRLGGAATALAAVSAAIVGLGMKAISIADQMGDLADATGLTSSQVKSFKDSVILAGGDADAFEKILAKLNQSTQEAAAGNEKMQKAFKDLGVYVRDSNGEVRNTGAILEDIIQKYKDGEITATEYAASIDLMGKSINRLDLTKLDAINDPFQNENYAQLQEYQNQIDKLSASVGDVLVQAFGSAAKEINIAIGYLIEFKNQLAGLYAQFGAQPAVSTRGGKFLPGFMQFLPLPKSKSQKRSEELDAEQAKTDATLERMGLGKTARDRMLAERRAKSTSGRGDYGVTVSKPKTGGGGGGKSDAEREAEARAKALQSAQNTTDELIFQNQESNKTRQLVLDTIGLDGDRANLIRANAQAESTGRQQVRDLQQKINEETAKGKNANQGVIAELQKQIVEKQAQVDKTKELNQQEYERTIQLGLQRNALQHQKDLIDLMSEKNTQSLVGVERERLLRGQISEKELTDRSKIIEAGEKYGSTMKRLEGDLEDAKKRQDTVAIDGINKQIEFEKQRHSLTMENIKAETEYEKKKQSSAAAGARSAIESIREQFSEYNVAQMTVSNLWNSMTNAIDTYIDTGKFKFSDFANSILRDMARVAAKAAASKIISGIFGAIFGGGIPSSASIGKSIPYGASLKLAAGGPAKKDMPYTVGEQGPELFVPNSTGRIITNATLNKNAGLGQGASPVVNNTYITNNINAIDSRSVAQMFVENRKSLLGATTLARKEQPY